jgi:glyoxylase-like metal-dependent hydrolase (beta-lactamase superfamily II)
VSARVHLLHAGYARSPSVGSSITFVEDGDARIVMDPGMVADRRTGILEPLAALGVAPESVTHVVLSHHHPDHTMNIALFPDAWVIDFWARYKDDQWLGHDGDGWAVGPSSRIWLTPGHTDQDISLIVDAEGGVHAMTHLWWKEDRTPEVDPYATQPDALIANRRRVLEVADVVIPGHGPAFRV